MTRIVHQPIATAPFEPYGGPPGRLDVADIVTTANSRSIAAGLCIAEGGPLVYRVDYDAMVVALDDDLVWQDATGPQELKAGDIVWIPEGARNSYWARGTSRFFYTTYPVNWAEIVGWQAGLDVKDLANQGGPTGNFDGIVTRRRADAAYSRFFDGAGCMDIAPLFGPADGVSMAAGLTRLDNAAMAYTVAYDAAMVALDGNFWIEAEGRRLTAAPGDLFWIPEGEPAIYGSDGAATIAYVCCPVDWAGRIGWTPGVP